MKKSIFLAVIGIFLTTSALAVQPPGFGSVLDNNSGTEGQILIHSGDARGNSDVGTWTNADFLKGDKGDTGDTGEQGATGENGTDGTNGESGSDGKDGTKGEEGVKGDTGDKGVDVNPKTVNDLQNQINKLNQPKYYFVPQVRVYDSKRLEVKPYAKFDVQNNMKFSEAGLKVTFKLGKSYEEKLIEEQNETLEMLTGLVSELHNIPNPEETLNLQYAEENYQIEVTETGSTVITNKF